MGIEHLNRSWRMSGKVVKWKHCKDLPSAPNCYKSQSLLVGCGVTVSHRGSEGGEWPRRCKTGKTGHPIAGALIGTQGAGGIASEKVCSRVVIVRDERRARPFERIGAGTENDRLSTDFVSVASDDEHATW